MKQRVLLIQEAMGGVGRHVVDLVNGLDPDRFDVTLVYGTSRLDDYYRAALPEMAHHARLIPCDDLVRPISPAHELRALMRIMRIMREVRPDVVHCHSSKAGVIGRTAALLYGVRRRGGKVFYTPHAYSFQAPEFSGRKRVVFVGLERWLSRLATDRTFNVSAGERNAALAERLDRPDKFVVVANGIANVRMPSQDEALAELGLNGVIPAGAPVIGVTARLVEQKDPMTSVRIAAGVIAQRPDVHAVYVGDGPFEAEMRAYCDERGIGGNVHFLGYRADAERIVAAFDVYLLSSLYEGMPYSLVEALRAGVQIAASNVAGNDEVVAPGINGVLFPVGDAEAGAKAVLQLLESPISRERVHHTFVARFTIAAMIARISRHYTGAAGAKAKGKR